MRFVFSWGLSGKVNGSYDTTDAFFGWGWVMGSVYVCMCVSSFTTAFG